MELAHALREARGSRLQDVGRFHLEDSIGADGGGLFPAWTIDDRGLPHPLSTPGREDHFRIAARDLQWIDDAVLGETRIGELRKDRSATGDVDEFLDPANPGDQRV